MSEPFIAEIRLWGMSWAPRGWAVCNGQVLPVAQNTALFSIIGTRYGGDGLSTLGLPNLQGRAAMGAGNAPGLSARVLGSNGGQATHTLTEVELPSHTHTLQAAQSPAGPVNSPTDALPVAAGGRGAGNYYGTQDQGDMSSNAVDSVGGGQSHENRQPVLAMTYTIALQGTYPSHA